MAGGHVICHRLHGLPLSLRVNFSCTPGPPERTRNQWPASSSSPKVMFRFSHSIRSRAMLVPFWRRLWEEAVVLWSRCVQIITHHTGHITPARTLSDSPLPLPCRVCLSGSASTFSCCTSSHLIVSRLHIDSCICCSQRYCVRSARCASSYG